MGFYNKELNGFNEIYSYVVNNEDGIYKLIYNDKIVNCSFETCYESDNGLDDSEDNYDEFEVIVFYNLRENYRFEINYKNIPNELYHNDKLVFKKSRKYKKVILEFDFLNGPIYKNIYDIKNNMVITGIKEIDNNENIMCLNQEMQDLYSSFYDQNRLSEDDPFNHHKIEENIKRLYQMKIQLIDGIKAVLPNIAIEDRTVDFFEKYL